MPLRKLPITDLNLLVVQYVRGKEDPATANLMSRLGEARGRGYLTTGEFRAACEWKSPRARKQFSRNAPHQIRMATEKALSSRSERVRLEALVSLRGVSVPMASAILTLLNPRRYGVLDIRVWQLLYGVGAVSRTPNGVGFRFDHWQEFLTIVRALAKAHRLKARDVELALFRAHQDHQAGRLYDRLARD